MSNSYHDLTGVLRLRQVTPVIKARASGCATPAKGCKQARKGRQRQR